MFYKNTQKHGRTWRLALISTICLFAVSAQAGTRLSLGDRKGTADQALAIPIEVASDEGLVALQIDLTYEEDAVSFDSVVAASFGTDHLIRTQEVADGRQRVLIYSPTNSILGDGVIADAQFDLLGSYDSNLNAFTVSQIRFVTSTGSVLSVALAPYVRLTSPSGGSSFSEFENTNISAVAFETVGEVTKVEFRVNGSVVVADTSAPFTANWLVNGLGETLLTAVAYDAEGDSNESPSTSVSVGSIQFVDDWREAVFSEEERSNASIAGLAADPDFDGIMNLLELAFGLDPLQKDLNGLPEGQLENGVDGKPYMTLHFEKPVSVTELDYIAEISSDLITWQSAEEFVAVESLGVEGDTERFRAQTVMPIDGEDSGAVFMRVRIEKAQ